MVRIGPLTEGQRRDLERVRRRAVGRVSQRAHMVLLSARGYTVRQIAEVFAVGEDVVRDWLHRYQREGPTGLDDRPRPGRPPRDRLARHIVDAQASQSPRAVGLVQSCWAVRLLAAFLLARFRLRLSPSSVRRHLKAGGWRWARPRLAPATHAPATHAPAGQRKVDPASEWKLAQVARALAAAATVLYLDECEVQLLPVIRNMWMKGPRVRVPTPGQNRRRAVFGALDARTGALHYAIRERKRAVDFVAFLERLARAYPTAELVLVLDNVITHDAKLVRAWLARPEHAHFRLLWLPKYSAHEHNPIERVWGLMKDRVAANRLHGSIEALAEVAERFLAETQLRAPRPQPAPAPVAMPQVA